MTVNSEIRVSVLDDFAPYAIYTILHPDIMKTMASQSKPVSLKETKRWVTGGKLFHDACRAGQVMAIIFADATNCSRVLYWGKLDRLKVTTEGTQYSVTNLTPLVHRTTQDCVLKSTNTPIAKGFIRPYAIVHTPVYIGTRSKRRPDENRASANDKPGGRFTQRRSGARSLSATTLFSFGYWGCGSATHELVEAIDAVETRRGFEPPLWVDIRGSRSVRAAGFRDKEFEKLLRGRYLWMEDLGNRRVLEGRKGIEIINPAAATDLLSRALENPKRRVIFFCACAHPAFCHRKEVGKLVLHYAKERRERVEIIEWPGGEPGTLTIDVSPSALRKIERGDTKSTVIPSSVTHLDAVALPWGTITTMRAGADQVNVLLGPTLFNAAGVHLRIIRDELGTRAGSKAFRRKFGYLKRT
jgi:hypothetical protein